MGLELIADEIVRGYCASYPVSLSSPPLCLYNGDSLNGECATLRDLIHDRLVHSNRADVVITVSFTSAFVPTQYVVDVAWFVQRSAFRSALETSTP